MSTKKNKRGQNCKPIMNKLEMRQDQENDLRNVDLQ